MRVEKIDKSLEAFKLLKRKNRIYKLLGFMFWVCVVSFLIGFVWNIYQELNWSLNDIPVKRSERISFLMSGPIYFFLPIVIYYILNTILERKNE